jgi:hypothetical protein
MVSAPFEGRKERGHAAKAGRPYCRLPGACGRLQNRAGQIQDAAMKADFLEMARRWNHLAETYEFVGSLERFLLDAHKNGWPFNVGNIPKPPADA